MWVGMRVGGLPVFFSVPPPKLQNLQKGVGLHYLLGAFEGGGAGNCAFHRPHLRATQQAQDHRESECAPLASKPPATGPPPAPLSAPPPANATEHEQGGTAPPPLATPTDCQSRQATAPDRNQAPTSATPWRTSAGPVKPRGESASLGGDHQSIPTHQRTDPTPQILALLRTCRTLPIAGH